MSLMQSALWTSHNKNFDFLANKSLAIDFDLITYICWVLQPIYEQVQVINKKSAPFSLTTI